ncbi:MAG: hypothetical protein R3E12_11120 [Candidatus Eisenbacteria bacterium]|uniref:Uncharacterized protein n=1 Tax=Eiseniibacteriota bacterium TaxID=2212470 RepID=A0A956LWC7_UNCEI|nr:hypothetical protein [Candidatus Eisenbacteria bacterium]
MVLPSYEDAHLVVAGIRVLAHKESKPPTPEEVASLVGLSEEKVHVLVHELSELHVIRVVKTPFTVHLDIIDPRPLEELPRGDQGPAMQQELADFGEKSREKKAEMDRMFRGGEAERRRKDRVAKLEEQFKTFKPKRGDLENMFGSSGEADEED